MHPQQTQTKFCGNAVYFEDWQYVSISILIVVGTWCGVPASVCRGKAASGKAACPPVAAKPPCDPLCGRAQLVEY